MKTILSEDELDLGDCPYLARWNNEAGHDPEAVEKVWDAYCPNVCRWWEVKEIP
jgi:hypothetical protein